VVLLLVLENDSDPTVAGCWNDVTNVSRYLQERGFTDLRQMTDREQETSNNYPNRANMLAAFQWLVADMQPGDSFVFHYSGKLHGLPCRKGEFSTAIFWRSLVRSFVISSLLMFVYVFATS
jgi:hypothetical protein